MMVFIQLTFDHPHPFSCHATFIEQSIISSIFLDLTQSLYLALSLLIWHYYTTIRHCYYVLKYCAFSSPLPFYQVVSCDNLFYVIAYQFLISHVLLHWIKAVKTSDVYGVNNTFIISQCKKKSYIIVIHFPSIFSHPFTSEILFYIVL